MCTELLKVHPKIHTVFMAINKDFKNCKTNRPDRFKIVLSKWYIVSKDVNVILIVMQPAKAQSQNLKYNLEQLGKISNYYSLSDDTQLLITMSYWPINWTLSVTYAWELLTITKMYNTILNILMFIISIAIVSIIIIIIIITLTVITISIVIVFTKNAWRIC